MNDTRYILRKHETIGIPDGMTGVPVRAYFASRNGRPSALPAGFEEALVYEIAGRAYIALPDEIEGRDG